MDSNKLMTKREAADRLSISTRTLDRIRSKGEIKAVQVGGQVRFRPEDVEKFISRILLVGTRRSASSQTL
jgi:excisionase family DNA binding protein